MQNAEEQDDFNLEEDENQQGGDQNNQGKGKESKVRKKFNNAMNLLTKALGGSIIFKHSSLVPDEVKQAVVELAKEEKEKLIASFKAKAISIIQRKREHDKLVKKLLQEANQKEEANMEGFIKECQELFGMIKNIQTIEKDYYDTLFNAANGDTVMMDKLFKEKSEVAKPGAENLKTGPEDNSSRNAINQ